MDDCSIRNYSPLIRPASGERVIVGLPSSFISQDLWKQQLLSPTLLLSRACPGASTLRKVSELIRTPRKRTYLRLQQEPLC